MSNETAFYKTSSLLFFEGVFIIQNVKTIAAYIIKMPVNTVVTEDSLPLVTELTIIPARKITMRMTWFLKTDKYLFINFISENGRNYKSSGFNFQK